ncbi:hypothetical protein K7X08_001790 [Anisodus acutangulus]|uniref:Large ribosomal subunit protein bL31c n=1 Tax=Anisodus acutangulus TaxID=402998 RepID=A0A9Q1LPF3_9SOLA|nr:hypothetical protein K7X08_001790 [Anisodus acutangulus]
MALTLSNTFLQKNVAPPTLSLKKVGIGSDQMRVRCRKKEIHPQFYDNAKVYCNGEHVMTTGGTKNEYTVDVWSGLLSKSSKTNSNPAAPKLTEEVYFKECLPRFLNIVLSMCLKVL